MKGASVHEKDEDLSQIIFEIINRHICVKKLPIQTEVALNVLRIFIL